MSGRDPELAARLARYEVVAAALEVQAAQVRVLAAELEVAALAKEKP